MVPSVMTLEQLMSQLPTLAMKSFAVEIINLGEGEFDFNVRVHPTDADEMMVKELRQYNADQKRIAELSTAILQAKAPVQN